MNHLIIGGGTQKPIKYRKMYTINKLISQLNIKNNDLVANKCKNYIGLKILN